LFSPLVWVPLLLASFKLVGQARHWPLWAPEATQVRLSKAPMGTCPCALLPPVSWLSCLVSAFPGVGAVLLTRPHGPWVYFSTQRTVALGHPIWPSSPPTPPTSQHGELSHRAPQLAVFVGLVS
jgi:hypothetical protein